MISPEPDAVLAQRRARRLIEPFDLVRNLLALEHAERFGKLKRYSARHAGHLIGSGEPEQRLQHPFDVRLEPKIEPPLHSIARRTSKMLVGDDAHARLEQFLAGDQLADGLPEPAQHTVGGEHELPVRGVRQPGCARVDLAGERFLRGAGERPRLRACGRGIRRENEFIEPADGVTLDHDFAALPDLGLENRILAQSTHQHAGAAVDEPLGEALMQRVRQLVLDRAGNALPVLGIGEPVGAVGGEGPSPDVGNAVRERVDVAVDAVRLLDLAGKPVNGNGAPPASGIHKA